MLVFETLYRRQLKTQLSLTLRNALNTQDKFQELKISVLSNIL